jgi:hypothetical protein
MGCLAMADAQILWYAVPKAGAVVPRNTSTNLADVRLSGVVTQTKYSSMRLRCKQDGKTIYDQLIPLSYSGGTAGFDRIIKIKAGRIRHNFEVELYSTDTLRYSITDVVAGDVYIIQGQSNAVANMYYLSSASYEDSFIRSFGTSAGNSYVLTDTFWYKAYGDGYYNSGCVGQWALVMAKKLLDSFGIPIALMNGAVGGTSVASHQRYNPQPDNYGTIYGRLLYRMRKGGLDKKVRGILWFQGESDGGNGALHDSLFRKLYAAWALDYKGMQKNYMVQVRGGGCVGVTASMLEIQRQFEFTLPKLQVVSSNGLNGHDGCHYWFVGGYQQLGIQFAALMARDLYNGKTVKHIDPPNVAKVEYHHANRNEIVLSMRGYADSLFVDAGFEALFSVAGDNTVSITGGRLEKNRVVLTLNKGTCSTLYVTYMGRSGKQPWVKNRLGMGLIGFDRVAVTDPPVRTAYNGCAGEVLRVQEDSIAGCTYDWKRSSDGLKRSAAGFDEVLSRDQEYRLIRSFNTAGCKSDTFFVYLSTDKTPVPEAGNDTLLCNGDSVTYRIPNLYSEVLWQQGGRSVNGLVFGTRKAGTLRLRTVSPLGCVRYDSLMVSTSKPQVQLPQDVWVCMGKDSLITVPTGFASYLWNGTKGGSSYRAGAGKLQLQVVDSAGCAAQDSAWVKVFVEQRFTIPNQQVCPYDSVQIAQPKGSIAWAENGSALPAVFYTGPRQFEVQYTDSNGCISEGAFEVQAKAVPTFSLGRDTGTCPGAEVELLCSFTTQLYTWNGQLSSSSKYNAAAAGWVWCKVQNIVGCSYTDSVYVAHYPEPDFYLVADTLLCRGDVWKLSLPAGYNYLLNGNPATQPSISIEGSYTISAVNNYGCMRSRAVDVRVQSCQNGVQDWAQDAGLFYPNPSEGVLYCKQAGELKVYDMQGKLLIKQDISAGAALDLSALAPGLYTCSMQGQHHIIQLQ